MKEKPQKLVYTYNPKRNEQTLKKLTSEPNWDILVNCS